MRHYSLALVLTACGPASFAQPPVSTSFDWNHADKRFGGLSGIELSDDGRSLTAIGDRGIIITAIIDRVQEKISAITNVAVQKIPNLSEPLKVYDTEGLAIGSDGEVHISIERTHQVVALKNGMANPLPSPDAFSEFVENGSLEALAVADDGALYAIPERSGRVSRPFPVYRYQNGVWDVAFTIPRVGQFLVVGADIGPDNRLYVLERHFNGFGFQSRLSRFALDGSGGQTLLQTPNGTHDNLEGVSIWQGPKGLIATMVSDDNFMFLQQTEIVEYDLPD